MHTTKPNNKTNRKRKTEPRCLITDFRTLLLNSSDLSSRSPQLTRHHWQRKLNYFFLQNMQLNLLKNKNHKIIPIVQPRSSHALDSFRFNSNRDPGAAHSHEFVGLTGQRADPPTRIGAQVNVEIFPPVTRNTASTAHPWTCALDCSTCVEDITPPGPPPVRTRQRRKTR